MKKKRFSVIMVLALVGLLFVAACSSSPPEPQGVQGEEVEQNEGDEHADTHPPEEHMAGEHDVPEEAAAVANPIEATNESIAAGGALYATNCALCHGETGEGDGPGAAGLEQAPADLHEEHVQELSDGALFYIISHGRPETPMPAWENVLNEEQRWQVVNFLRTFKE